MVSHGETKSATLSMKDDKSPGPDGYTSLEFKRDWEIVGNYVVEAIFDFFRMSKILIKMKSMATYLVQKGLHSSSLYNYLSI